MPRASQDTRQRLLCRGPFQLALGKEPSFAESQTEGSRQRGRRQSAFGGQGLCESPPLPSELFSAKSLFAESLHSALGKESFAERVTWPSAKEALCRESTRQLSAKMSALGTSLCTRLWQKRHRRLRYIHNSPTYFHSCCDVNFENK